MKSELYDILAEMVLELSPKRIEVLAKAVERVIRQSELLRSC